MRCVRATSPWCEDHKVETIRGNVIGILTLCDVANELGVHVTNFATVGLRTYWRPPHPMPVATYSVSETSSQNAPNFLTQLYSI